MAIPDAARNQLATTRKIYKSVAKCQAAGTNPNPVVAHARTTDRIDDPIENLLDAIATLHASQVL
jgi:hypothetical protein